MPLRPLGVGEILDGAISCMRAYPKAMLGLSALVVTVAQVVQLVVSWWLLSDLESVDLESADSFSDVSGVLADSGIAALIGLVLTVLAQLVLTGVLTVVVSRAVLGQSATIGDAWQVARPQLLRLVGLTILVALGEAVGLLFCVLPGVYLWALWGLSTPALILERQRVIPAIGRSRHLVRGSWWRVFGILLLAWLIGMVIGGIVSVPFSAFGGGFNFLNADVANGSVSLLGLTLSALGGILAGTITYPFSAAVSVLLYVDLRMRREALDLELARAAGVALPGQPPSGPAPDVPAPPSPPPAAPGAQPPNSSPHGT